VGPAAGASDAALPGAEQAPTLEALRTRYGDAPALAHFSGEVSYYADSLAGHATASGRPYDPNLATAAHRDLPFGSVLRLRRVPDGPSCLVVVNDRGPFGKKSRVLDVSGAAADALGLRRAGVAEVEVEVLYRPAKKRRP